MISTTATGVLSTLIYTAFCVVIGIVAFWMGLRRGERPVRGRRTKVTPAVAASTVSSQAKRTPERLKPLVRDDSAAYTKELEERQAETMNDRLI